VADLGAAAAAFRIDSVASMGRPSPRKLLFLETLTKDPRKLASLGLVNSQIFDVRAFTRDLAKEMGEGTDGRDGDAKGEKAATRGALGEVYTLPESLKERPSSSSRCFSS